LPFRTANGAVQATRQVSLFACGEWIAVRRIGRAMNSPAANNWRFSQRPRR